MSEPVEIGAAIASGGMSLLNSAIGNSMSRSNARYAQKLQKEMLDYQWKNFSSPAAQARSLAAAGLNPSVAFGQGSVSHVATPSAAAQSISPVDVGLSGQDMASTILALSEAKKAGSEAAGTDLDNFLKQSTMDESIKAAALRNNWTKAEITKIDAECSNFSALWQKTQQEIENLKSEKQLTDKVVDWYDKEMRAKIDELTASAKYKDALADLTDTQKELLDATFDDLCDITHSNADIQRTAAKLLNRYGDAQAIVGMLSELVGSSSDLIGSFTSYKRLGKAFDEVSDEIISNGSSIVTKHKHVHKK